MARYYEHTDSRGHLHTHYSGAVLLAKKASKPITQEDLDELDRKIAIAQRELRLYRYPELLEEYRKALKDGKDAVQTLDEIEKAHPELGETK